MRLAHPRGAVNHHRTDAQLRGLDQRLAGLEREQVAIPGHVSVEGVIAVHLSDHRRGRGRGAGRLRLFHMAAHIAGRDETDILERSERLDDGALDHEAKPLVEPLAGHRGARLHHERGTLQSQCPRALQPGGIVVRVELEFQPAEHGQPPAGERTKVLGGRLFVHNLERTPLSRGTAGSCRQRRPGLVFDGRVGGFRVDRHGASARGRRR